MIFILINFLFNGFLLSMVYVIAILGLFDKQSYFYHAPNWVIFVFGYATALLLTLIGISKLGQYLLRLFVGGHKITLREQQKLSPLLNTVLEQSNQLKGTKFDPKYIHIIVKNSKEPSTRALGHNTIIVSDGLLNNVSDDELQAVLAHEVGHLYYKDSVLLIAFIYGSLATAIVMWLYTVYARLSTGFTRMFSSSSHDGAGFMALFTLLPLLIFLPIILLNRIGSYLLDLSMLFMGRHYEYRADRFAGSLGYQAGLISFLEKMQQISEADDSFWGKVLATYPQAKERIDQLERQAFVQSGSSCNN